jgi:hypothetical protein
MSGGKRDPGERALAGIRIGQMLDLYKLIVRGRGRENENLMTSKEEA